MSSPRSRAAAWHQQALPRRTSLLLVVALVGALAIGIAPRPATAAPATDARWAARALVISDRTGDPGWQVATNRAVQAWNEAGAGITLVWSEGGIGCDAGGPVVPVCRDVLRRGWQASTRRLRATDGTIAGSAIRVDATRAFPQHLKDVIACHEVGHVLGLAHSGDQASCLGHRSRSARPSAADVASLRATYGPRV